MSGERPIKTNVFLFKQAGNMSRDKIELMTEKKQTQNLLATENKKKDVNKFQSIGFNRFSPSWKKSTKF